tara:strand:+ start:226 stop:444 length:219 start_codon:yes stop_codon:yes gene_type:complete
MLIWMRVQRYLSPPCEPVRMHQQRARNSFRPNQEPPAMRQVERAVRLHEVVRRITVASLSHRSKKTFVKARS